MTLTDSQSNREVSDHLYSLHKRIWSGTEFNFRRFEDYALAVMDYQRNGFNVSEHERFVEEYKALLIKRKQM